MLLRYLSPECSQIDCLSVAVYSGGLYQRGWDMLFLFWGGISFAVYFELLDSSGDSALQKSGGEFS